MVRRQRGCLPKQAVDGEACGQHRHVERSTVVRHQPRGGGEVGGEGTQERRLVRIVGEQVLPHGDPAAVDAADGREEDHGAGPGRKPGGLGVEVRPLRVRRQRLGHAPLHGKPPLDDEGGAVPDDFGARIEPAREGLDPVTRVPRTLLRRCALGSDDGQPLGEAAGGRHWSAHPAEELEGDGLALRSDLEGRADAGGTAVGARA